MKSFLTAIFKDSLTLMWKKMVVINVFLVVSYTKMMQEATVPLFCLTEYY